MNKKALDILGDNFVYKWIFDKNEDKKKLLCYEFKNKSNIPNCKKTQFINDKINELIKNGYVDVEDLKIPKFGRFILIRLKTIEDYEKEKIIIQKEYLEKISLIDHKISSILNYENN